MPVSALPFPNFDPVLDQIGPFAIRWYALAYIVGILLGWVYARSADPQRAILGRPRAADGHGFRRLHRLGDARHHPRRPHRLRAVLQPCALPRASARRFSSCGTAACRSMAASSAACWPWCCSPRKRGISILSLGDITCAVGADRPVPRADRQLHQWRTVGPPDRRAVGVGVPQRRTAAAPSKPAL